MSQEQIYIGTLLHPHDIRVEKKGTRKVKQPYSPDIEEWDRRAMWSYIRLQKGKQQADRELKDHFETLRLMYDRPMRKAEREMHMRQYFSDFVEAQKNPRTVQFILDGTKVMAVASLKHLLIPPASVYSSVQRIISSGVLKGLDSIDVKQLQGETYQVKQVGGLKLGVQVFGGDILTRQAITVSSWLRVEMCFNPLSWLSIGSFGNLLGGSGSSYERILRIKHEKELDTRLKEAIDAMTNTEAIEATVKKAKRVKVSEEEARIVASAFGLSYSLGAKTISQILDRFAKEPKSQWGLSMASSWVAAHGHFKATPEDCDRNVEQKLSTISGAELLIKNLKETKEKSLAWLKAHVKAGEVKSLDDLLGDLVK